MDFYNAKENIVNIAMLAAELLMAGKIERDDMTGHAGLTDMIINLAEQFEKENASVDFNTGDRDYWLEIDAFAEEQLLERYGVEKAQEDKPLDIKVIMDRGILETVLKDQHIPVHVEVVYVDPDYEDYEQLEAYKNELYKDPAFFECDYTSCHFEPDFNVSEPEYENEAGDGVQPDLQAVSVVAVIGNTEFGSVFSGTWDECEQYCNEIKWSFWDENNVRWELEIRDPLELSLPEGFYRAVDHFSDALGVDIHNGFVRQHAEELVFCHKNNIDFADFDYWTRYQVLLGEKISYGDYTALDHHFHRDPNDIAVKDKYSIDKIRGYLEGCRSERKAVLSLDEKIAKANNTRMSQQPIQSLGETLEK